MAEAARTTLKQRMQMAGVIAGVAFTFNSLFWIASHFYFADKPLEAASIGSVRAAFGMMSVIVAGMAYAAALAPRFIGHALAAAMGLASLVGGIAALVKGLPPVTGMTMLVVGGLIPPLTWKSLARSRAAWSFLIALVAVFGAVCFFGAPKVRTLLGIGLWHAMIIPGLQVVCVMALAMVRDEYRD
jgi:MFS family permease